MGDQETTRKGRRRFLIQGAGLLAGAAGMDGIGAALEAPTAEFEAYVRRDATALAEWLASGEVTATELLDLALARADAVNPVINALVMRHEDLARRQIRGGLADGPFRGVPWLLKDLHLKLAGTPTTNGSVFFRDAVADHDSTLVTRYRDAGLVIFGKTHSPEFGGTATTESALWGQTRNPWRLDRSAGGSSGGAAAAVAAGVLPAANASDGGGSIRIPASACGLFGLKPTRARTPLGPRRFEGANGQSVVHAVTRSVRDSAGLLDVSRGPEPGMPYHAPAVERPYLEELQRPPGRLRIALMTRPVFPLPVHADCLAAADGAARLCEELGHAVEEAAPAIPAREYYGAVSVISAVGTLALVTARERALGRTVTEADLEPIMYQRMLKGKTVSGLDYANARETYHQMGAILGRFHQDYDLILSPTMAAPPPLLGEMSLSGDPKTYEQAAIDASVFTQLFNVTGQPAMSVPLHWSADGLPIGVQFAAPFGGEATLFRLAAQLEQARPWFHRRPPVERPA